MSGAGAGPETEEQPCALRALNICDGHSVERHAGGLTLCWCDSEELAKEVGWSGAAESAARSRRVELAAWVLHPSAR